MVKFEIRPPPLQVYIKAKKMNPALKYILEAAINYEKTTEGSAKRDIAVDEMYVKLIVHPLQLAWIRAKSKEHHCICCYRWRLILSKLKEVA